MVNFAAAGHDPTPLPPTSLLPCPTATYQAHRLSYQPCPTAINNTAITPTHSTPYYDKITTKLGFNSCRKPHGIGCLTPASAAMQTAKPYHTRCYSTRPINQATTLPLGLSTHCYQNSWLPAAPGFTWLPWLFRSTDRTPRCHKPPTATPPSHNLAVLLSLLSWLLSTSTPPWLVEIYAVYPTKAPGFSSPPPHGS